MTKHSDRENQRSNSSTFAGHPPASLARSIQRFGTLRYVPLGLSDETRLASVEALNQILADTTSLRDLYKKCHWQMVGPTFYELHLLFDKHFEEQSELVDLVAERVQTLGGVAIALAHDVAEHQSLPRAPIDAEDVPTMLTRLVQAHMQILNECRTGARTAQDRGDDGTNDLLVSSLIRTNELQSWFVNEHRVDTPLFTEGMTHEATRVPDSAGKLHS